MVMYGAVVGREVYPLGSCAVFISPLTKLYKLQCMCVHVRVWRERERERERESESEREREREREREPLQEMHYLDSETETVWCISLLTIHYGAAY